MSNKVAGVDVLLTVKTGVSTFTTIGGQKGASLTRSANTMDVTDKNSAGWVTSMAGLKTWAIECDGFIVLGDTALEALYTAFDARATIDITIRIGGATDTHGYTYTGTVIITDFPEEYKQEDAVTFKLSLKGASPLVRVVGIV